MQILLSDTSVDEEYLYFQQYIDIHLEDVDELNDLMDGLHQKRH